MNIFSRNIPRIIIVEINSKKKDSVDIVWNKKKKISEKYKKREREKKEKREKLQQHLKLCKSKTKFKK